MYKIYFLDDKRRLRSFRTIAVDVEDAITRLFMKDPMESKEYKLIKIQHLVL